jgi:hypothetical protein
MERLIAVDSRYDVFVSHSAMDTWVARQIATQMIDRGAVPFLDEVSIAVGGRFEDEILAALDQAKEVMVILTPWALNRPYVWAELGAAWGKRIPIVGVLYGLTTQDLQGRPEVPIFIKQRDFISLNNIDDYLSQLAQRVASWNGGATRHA